MNQIVLFKLITNNAHVQWKWIKVINIDQVVSLMSDVVFCNDYDCV